MLYAGSTRISPILTREVSKPLDPLSDVCFYDYDGTLLYTYTLEEANALTALPPQPEHPGLIADGWNWDLASVKALTTHMDIGGMYRTDDDSCRLYLHVYNEYLTDVSVNVGCQTVGQWTIDWGDGSDYTPVTATTCQSYFHKYAATGDYVIKIRHVTGTGRLYMGGNYRAVFGQYPHPTNSQSAYNVVETRSLYKIELSKYSDLSVSASMWTFSRLSSVETITFPKLVHGGNTTLRSKYQFQRLESIKYITIPYGTTALTGTDSFFYMCVSLKGVSFPSTMSGTASTVLGYMFQYCGVLVRLCFPQNICAASVDTRGMVSPNCAALREVVLPSNITRIWDGTFNGCYSLRSIYSGSELGLPPDLVTISPNAFANCYNLAVRGLPSTVTTVGAGAFTVADNMTGVDGVYDVSNTKVTALNSAFKRYGANVIKLPGTITSIADSAINDPACRILDMSEFTAVPTLAASSGITLRNGPAKIIVPDNLYDTWKTSTNWTGKAFQIIKYSERDNLTFADYTWNNWLTWYDGILNAGLNAAHNPNATTWVNLANSSDNATLTSNGSFDGNSLVCTGGETTTDSFAAAFANGRSYGLGTGTNNDSTAEAVTIEVVFKLTSRWGHTNASTQGPQLLFVPRMSSTANSGQRSMGWTAAGTDSTGRMSVNLQANADSAFDFSQYFGHAITVTAVHQTERRIYVNGVKVGTTYTNPAGRDGDASYTGIGGRYLSSTGKGYYGMSGNIYCIRVYRRQLSDTEIARNHAVDRVRFGLEE